ncbi:chromate transporter [Mycolicibacterium madagascariense]|uniref:Chromate transporter n=1 Tax=Mycolicibacterium madagascariense TaxID=212765 RepID=A0A7I7XM42_9MYCO|nr:chromate transporter [Mycolicibacterium madagascariense]MCV7012618.1 chromate transporter [Mycolicibacterium madagascariense]BBZ30299.1 chromate transporter [Mycolicibacterium madagascariense]
MSTYLQLVVLFGSLSLMSFGGGNAVLPEMHLRAVHQHRWLTDGQFADLFSISQTTPGPSILIVGMVGYAAGLPVGGVLGGILGGVIATVAMVVPAASLVYAITLFWQRAEQSRWRLAVEKGLAPLTVGLILASALVMSRAADHDWRTYLLTAVCTVIFVRTSINPLVVVAIAGVIGYFGIV